MEIDFDIPLWFFTTISVLLVVIVGVSEWFNSKGNLKIVYPMNILKYTGFIILETAIALNDPAQAAILLFNISNSWGLAMNIKGLIRLYQESKASKQKKPPQILKD